MPLVGYLKSSEPGRISSITNRDGDKTRRKKIYPIVEGMPDPVYAMYVLDCFTHEPGGVVVPVVLKLLAPTGGWDELGVAKCCPLCWRILQPPVGVDLPEAVDQPFWEQLTTGYKPKVKPVSSVRKTERITRTGYQIQQEILGFLEPLAGESVYEIMALLGCSRQTALKHLDRLVKQGKLVKDQSEGGGGHKSIYMIVPRKIEA